jgi:hypothetical protein
MRCSSGILKEATDETIGLEFRCNCSFGGKVAYPPLASGQVDGEAA